MLLEGLQTTPSIEVFHFRTLEEFRSFEQPNDARVLPLSGRSASARAIVRMPESQLVVKRTFPRILDVNYKTDGMLFLLPLTSAANFKINGTVIDPSSIVIVRGQADCHIVETQANLLAMISLDPAIVERGWPVKNGLQIVRASGARLQSFRSMVSSLLSVASQQPHNRVALRDLEQGLLASLNKIAKTSSPVVQPSGFSRYLRVIEQIDEYHQLHPDADAHTDELASYCDVSARTLQTATQRVRGMSLRRYVRLRQLWSVRRILSIGRLDTVISDVARANGFRHMGEFTKIYRRAFGETASATLTRTRGQGLEMESHSLVVSPDSEPRSH